MRRGEKSTDAPLHIIEKRHEAEIHVELLMAVEEGEAGIVGDECNFGLLVAVEHKNIFEDTGGGFAGDADEFEAVAMQMDGMNVVAGIAESEAVALALQKSE